MSHNPRIDDIATRVDTLQAEGYPFLSAISRVAELLEISTATVDSCYGAALSGIYENVTPDPDPYDVTVDDWSEDFWR